jgi:hypothetical protein
MQGRRAGGRLGASVQGGSGEVGGSRRGGGIGPKCWFVPGSKEKMSYKYSDMKYLEASLRAEQTSMITGDRHENE